MNHSGTNRFGYPVENTHTKNNTCDSIRGPHWAEIHNTYFDADKNTTVDGDVLASISIGAWKDKDPDSDGAVIASVMLTKGGDVVVDYRDLRAQYDTMAQEAIQGAKKQLKAYYLEQRYQPKEELPDEVVVRMAHYAGEMEALKKIAPPEWEELCAAIHDSIREYYDSPSEKKPFHIEDIAERTFLARFPNQEEQTKPIQAFTLPDGSCVNFEVNNGMVGRDAQDDRTWLSLDVSLKRPDGHSELLCAVDYEDDLGLRTVVYAPGKEAPVFVQKNELESFYYTFGISDSFPFQKGWVEVQAMDQKQANELFRAHFQDRIPGILNCSDYYQGAKFREMSENWPKDWRICHAVIKSDGSIQYNKAAGLDQQIRAAAEQKDSAAMLQNQRKDMER